MSELSAQINRPTGDEYLLAPSAHVLTPGTPSVPEVKGLKIAGRSKGVSKVSDAGVVLLGEAHTDSLDDILISRLISSTARPGDVVLIEGIPSMRRVNKTTAYQTSQITQSVLVYGWDNITLRDKGAANVRKLISMAERLEQDVLTPQQRINLDRQFWALKRATDKTVINERNKSLMETIQKIRKKHPGAVIFVIGGSRHFTEDPALTAQLDRQKIPYMKLIAPEASPDFERTKEYFNGKSGQAPETKKHILTIRYPDGRIDELGQDWFTAKGAIKPGDVVFSDPNTGTESDRERLKLRPGVPYKVLKVD